MKRLAFAAAAGAITLASLAVRDEKKAADVPPPYIPGWVRPEAVDDPPAPEAEGAPWGCDPTDCNGTSSPPSSGR